MKICWQENSWNEYLYWQENDKRITKKINSLIKDIIRNPNEKGIGKSELLKYSGDLVSRRINEKHRLVYRISGNTIEIMKCRHHY